MSSDDLLQPMSNLMLPMLVWMLTVFCNQCSYLRMALVVDGGGGSAAKGSMSLLHFMP